MFADNNRIGNVQNNIVPLSGLKKLGITTVVALSAIGTVTGALAVLASLGVNIHLLNISLNGLKILTLYGGGALALTSFVVLVIMIVWIVRRACCGGQERVVRGNDNLHPYNGGNQPPFGGNPHQIPVNNFGQNLGIQPYPVNDHPIVPQNPLDDIQLPPGNNPQQPNNLGDEIQQPQNPHAENHQQREDIVLYPQPFYPLQEEVRFPTQPEVVFLYPFNQVNEFDDSSDEGDSENDYEVPKTPLFPDSIEESESDEIVIEEKRVRLLKVEDPNRKPNWQTQNEKPTTIEETKPVIQATPINLQNSELENLREERLKRLNSRPVTTPSKKEKDEQETKVEPHVTNAELLKLQANKYKKEQLKIETISSNNSSLPLQNRDLKEIKLPKLTNEEKTGFKPLDTLKRQRIAKTHPQHPKSSLLVENLENSVEKSVIILSKSALAGSEKIQVERQRTGFIQKMVGYVQGLMKGEVILWNNMKQQTLKGCISNVEHVEQVEVFIMKQIEIFNGSLKQYGLDEITIFEIIDPTALSMWKNLLKLQNERAILKEPELTFLEKCAESGQLPKDLLGLITQITKKPVYGSVYAKKVYEKLESAFGIKQQGFSLEKKELFIPVSCEEYAEKFQEQLKEDVISLFKLNQEPPLQICHLEKIMKHLDQEGKAFNKKYEVEINCCNLFGELFHFVDEFQMRVIPIIEESNSEQQAVQLIELQSFVEEKQDILDLCSLKLDLSLSEQQLAKFEVWNLIKALNSSEASNLDKARLFIQCVEKLPNENDVFWQKFPKLMREIEEKLSAWVMNDPFKETITCNEPGVVELMLEFEKAAKFLEEKLKATNFKLNLTLNERPFMSEVRHIRHQVLSSILEMINENIEALYDQRDIEFVRNNRELINNIQTLRNTHSREEIKLMGYTEDQLILAGILE